MAWKSQNRLAQKVYNGHTSSFVYGPDGLRRQMTVDGITTDFVLDGQNVVQERVGGNPSATYFNGPDGVAYRQDDTVSVNEYDQDGNAVSRHPMRFYIFDGLGSVLAEVDINGKVNPDQNGVEHPLRRYEVFGKERGTPVPSTSNHKFCGSLGHTTEDNTGLIYMRARYYDPSLGRFISEDPAGQGKNWYVYCGNNPVNFIDRDGKWVMFALGVVIIALAVYAIVTAVIGAGEFIRSGNAAFESSMKERRKAEAGQGGYNLDNDHNEIMDDCQRRWKQVGGNEDDFKTMVEEGANRAFESYTGYPGSGPTR
jgi:RHS repeat-associated protein